MRKYVLFMLYVNAFELIGIRSICCRNECRNDDWETGSTRSSTSSHEGGGEVSVIYYFCTRDVFYNISFSFFAV